MHDHPRLRSARPRPPGNSRITRKTVAKLPSTPTKFSRSSAASSFAGIPMGDARRFIGVDVQTSRGCAFAVLDEHGVAVASGWLPRNDSAGAKSALLGIVRRQSDGAAHSVLVGIDAPRQPLRMRREWYWDGGRSVWRRARESDKGIGRHCEVVIAAHRLASPQWTPFAIDAKSWMKLGFELYDMPREEAEVHEVFPSASYAQLRGDPVARLGVDLSQFAGGAKDMLDAHVAAYTVREFALGRGTAVGGGDSLGEIALPRPLKVPKPEVLRWPSG